MQGVFITGTDTGVGKTIVAAAVVAAVRSSGIEAVPMKPVQTGCAQDEHGLHAPDLDLCLDLNGLEMSPQEKDMLCPFRYRMACSPHLAAAHEGPILSLEALVQAVKRAAVHHPFLVVEGAGGVLVPLNETSMMTDLMRELALPVLLVTRPGLGTINHTLLSLNAIREAGCALAGVAVNQAHAAPMGIIEEDNLRVIAHRGEVKVMMQLPYIENLSNLPPQAFKQAISPHIRPLSRHFLQPS